ncbi:MAG TPA: L-type lectin-domain containing protein [Solirubrobacterales bacterium]|jgi:hypothetical protein|nr:L-type lectin-domain containing protein [Solirubrobacterales bacterium]
MRRRLTGISLSLIAALAVVSPAGAATFSYPDFAGTAGLTLSGNAAQEGNLLRLTPALGFKSGRAFRTEAIDPQQSFQTSFAISMHDSICCSVPTLKPADGMAFVLQSKAPNAGEGTGGSLGYGGIVPSVAVEFDIFVNAGDPATDHVGIVTEGNTTSHLQCANFSGPTAPCTAGLPFPLYGAPVYGWVDYDAGTQHLKVYVNQTATKPATPVLDSPVSMAPLGGAAYVGLTAATGAHNSVHDVLSWSFNPPSAATTTPPSGTPAPPAGKAATKKCKSKKGKAKAKGKASDSKKKGKGKKCGAKKGKGKKGAKQG